MDARESREARLQGESHRPVSRGHECPAEAYAELGMLWVGYSLPEEKPAGLRPVRAGRTNRNLEELKKWQVFSHRILLGAWLLMRGGWGWKGRVKSVVSPCLEIRVLLELRAGNKNKAARDVK